MQARPRRPGCRAGPRRRRPASPGGRRRTRPARPSPPRWGTEPRTGTTPQRPGPPAPRWRGCAAPCVPAAARPAPRPPARQLSARRIPPPRRPRCHTRHTPGSAPGSRRSPAARTACRPSRRRACRASASRCRSQAAALPAPAAGAIAQGVQEPRFADPAPFLDDDPVHHRDLPGRAAEAERRDAQPDPERRAEADAVQGRRAASGHADGGAPALSLR